MKREYGEVAPSAKSVTAPATVSGERRQKPLAQKAGKDGQASTRKSGDLPSI